MDRKLGCVLLIDDDEPTNYLNLRVLRKADCANQVRAVQTAQEALDSLSRGDRALEKGNPCSLPDLIFLDINMPGLSGWDFLEAYGRLRIPEEEKAVIVMLTSSFNPDDRNRALSLGDVAEFESKPLTVKAVACILEKYF
jgi:CheY-like chemotaxis protein